MEGNQVGMEPQNSSNQTGSPVAAEPATGAANASSDATPFVSVDSEFTNEQILKLLWPTNLIARISDRYNIRLWSSGLSLVNFLIAILIGVALGPMQLILMVVTQDYLFVTEQYFPMVMRICLIATGLLAVSVMIAMFQTWREQPRRSTSSVILGFGSILICLIVWLEEKFTDFKPNQLTIIMVLLIALTAVAALSTSRFFYNTEKRHTFLTVGILTVILIGAVETAFSFTYLFTQAHDTEVWQSDLDTLIHDQLAARTEGVTPELSDLTFTICNGAYDAVFIPSYAKNTGIFQCRNTHDVYAISGPLAPTTANTTGNVMLGEAFYFGTTASDFVSQYFPPKSGVKYIYRDLSSKNQPTELVMLVPAGSEEVLVNTYMEPLTRLVNAHNAASIASKQNNPLTLGIFYSEELNSVLSTRDFILIAAGGTISLSDYLPGGTNYRGVIDEKTGLYIFSSATNLPALSELGTSPLLYSAQTRHAITELRHISLTFDGLREYSFDEVRDLLYANFRDPIAANAAPMTPPEETTPAPVEETPTEETPEESGAEPEPTEPEDDDDSDDSDEEE